jgi:hypothetical protein
MNKAIQIKKPIIFVLSIDTEEEWDWSGPFPQGHGDVQNILQVPAFHTVLSSFNIRPTYFVDYAVLKTAQSVENMQWVIQQRNCEIGAHLHPWCNPPYFGDVGEAQSHVVNLPVQEVAAKVKALVSKIEQTLDVTPKSFRSGRWGIDGKVMNLLFQNGFNVDSSVYSYYKNEFFSCIGAPPTPYWAALDKPLEQTTQQNMFELPVTVGFNRENFDFWNRVHYLFTQPPLSWTRFNGFAWHTRLMRKNYLCPELSSVEDMINLCDTAIDKGYPVLHMYMHSSSLLDNSNNILGQNNAFNHLCGSIEQVVRYLEKHYEVEFCTISEAADKLKS